MMDMQQWLWGFGVFFSRSGCICGMGWSFRGILHGQALAGVGLHELRFWTCVYFVCF